MDILEEQQFAVAAVREAARLCQYVQHVLVQPPAEAKPNRTPVTVADYGAQAVVCRLIKKRFPDDGIIAEEHATEMLAAGGEMADQVIDAVRHTTDTSADLETICQWIDAGASAPTSRQWVLDPVDGTKGFLRRQHYAIALALLIDGQPRLGVLGCPSFPGPTGAHGCLFVAREGKGARQMSLDGEDEGVLQRVSTETEGPNLVLVESVESEHANQELHHQIAKQLGIRREPLRYDSQVKYGVVASGQASIYLRLAHPSRPDHRQRIWDHAAGWMVVTEAGGKVSDIRGEALDFSCGSRLGNPGGVVCSNGACHERVVAAIRQCI